MDEAQAALLTLPGAPVVYQRARALCVIACGSRLGGCTTARYASFETSTPHLWELASRAARWWKFDKRAKKYEEALPPKWSIETLRPQAVAFPVLEGIVCSPTLRPDGSLLMTSGYDPETGLIST